MEEFNDEEVIRQVENNDPELVELELGLDGCVPPDGDWGRLGTYIGRNTHLRKLTLRDYDIFREEDLEKFLRVVACSRSIQKLSFCGYYLFGGKIFRILRPLFESNQVECLELSGQENGGVMPLACLRLLATALGEFDSLREFGLAYCYIDHNGMEELIRALAGHSGLKTIDLQCSAIGRNVCAALTTLLQNPNSKLTALDLRYSEIGDEGAGILAPGLAGNRALKDLNLSENHSITAMGWQSIFDALQSPSCRLEKLSLDCNIGINDAAAILLSSTLTNNITLKSLNLSDCGDNITITGWRALFGFLHDPTCTLEELVLSCNNEFNNNVTISLSNALNNNRSLKTLNLSRNSGITTAGWQAFSTVLQSTNSGLEKLDLGDNSINDEAVNSITNALVNNTKLRELNLCCNEQVTATGWLALSAVLESPYSALEKLDLRYNSINDDTLVSFANSLVNNSKLKELVIFHQDITANGWDEFSRVLCNTSSIMDTYQSNHTLQKLCKEHFEDAHFPRDLKSLLQINRDNSKSQAARLKIIKTYFSGDFAVQPFVGMEWNVLPHAIAWMGRDGKCNETNGHLYELVKSVPLLFDAERNNTSSSV